MMMKAVGFREAGPIDKADALVDVELPKPNATGRDLLVKVCAVSVNPVDTKVRSGKIPKGDAEVRVLGFDAAGVIEQVGNECANTSNLKVGDEVYYSGSIARPGTNSEYHLVDERIVAHKPTSLSMVQAAALPLTTITAWEMLFDRLDVNKPTVQGGDTILIIGGAGGVGSMAIQLLRARTEMTVIATASRDETKEWVQKLGAHHVINHRQPMAPQIKEMGIPAPGFVFSTTNTEDHLLDIVELMPPQGRLGLIDDPTNAFPIMALKKKSISLHWELMFTRPVFQTIDMDEQGKLLEKVAKLVEQGKIQSTATFTAGKIDAATLTKVHTVIESGKAKGKIVLEGF
ncbi:alcohol dehydrogenase-like protein SE_1777 [Seminavis robusta]|uniref:Alcohol dehydrogenase-like protein SE_1777 n=1 Tax=Seminavis robusta TaxID=568900 RepID=A0A9N8DXI9_9STRA|nr:alcohol dehydrogenase-like protein SE_1777 [Seminavis robusta]|eukprot:Sro355_g125180.1 alcohol dehydrogenase-like protein SE_1777 (345) ;mRNA; f:70902-71936